MSTTRNIREYTLPELKEYFESIGDKKFRAIQTYEWLWKKNARHFDDMSNLSLELRKKLAEDFTLQAITVDVTQTSSDGKVTMQVNYHDDATLLASLERNHFHLLSVFRIDYPKPNGTSDIHLVIIAQK